MLSKEDYKKYLDQMAEIELAMIKAYSECIPLTEDEELKKILSNIVNDETYHLKLVISLKELLL